MQRVDEVDELKVGSYYYVRCARFRDGDDHRWLPILCEHVGDFTGQFHYHLDFRFTDYRTTKALYERTTEFSWRPLRCFRQHDNGNPYRDIPEWFDQFQEPNVRKGLQCDLACRKCPHQGTDLRQVVPVTEGDREVLVCPAHYLAFDAQTGRITRRVPFASHIERRRRERDTKQEPA